MSLYLEINYAKIIGQQLERFKVKKESPFHGNSRCPICLDSAKSKSKTRFHILEKSGKLMVFCHNCNYSRTFISFLKDNHPNTYSDFAFEKYRDGAKDTPVITTPVAVKQVSKEIVNDIVKLAIPYVTDLPIDHPVRSYIASRKLPDYPFQITDRFYAFSKQYNDDIPDTEPEKDELRLVIPFFDKTGSVYAFQGRDMSGKSQQKYITIIVNKKIPKIFGLDRINFKKPIKIVEGPLDSLFLPNTLAAVNASLVSVAKRLDQVINKSLVTLVYDNENRNKVIVAAYQEAIKQGYNICIWPPECEGKKDINDLVIAGFNPQKIIEKNTFSGLMAQIEFNKWKRI